VDTDFANYTYILALIRKPFYSGLLPYFRACWPTRNHSGYWNSLVSGHQARSGTYMTVIFELQYPLREGFIAPVLTGGLPESDLDHGKCQLIRKQYNTPAAVTGRSGRNRKHKKH
jgi:hypothetical protein